MRAKRGLFLRRACGKLPAFWFGRAPRVRGPFFATCLRKTAAPLVWAGAARAGGPFFASCLRKPPPFRLGGGRVEAFPRDVPAENRRPSDLGGVPGPKPASALRLRKSRLSRRFLFGMRAKRGLFLRRACGKLPAFWFGRAPRERGGLFSRRACGNHRPSDLGGARERGPSFALRLRKIAALPVWVGCPGRGLLSRCACGKRNPSGLGGVTGREGAFFRVAPVANRRPSGLGGCRANGGLFSQRACGKPLAFRLGWGVTGRAGISRAAALFPIVWGIFRQAMAKA